MRKKEPMLIFIKIFQSLRGLPPLNLSFNRGKIREKDFAGILHDVLGLEHFSQLKRNVVPFFLHHFFFVR